MQALSNFKFRDSKRLQLLKFDGIDSFLYGDTQLIYFNDIREHLGSKVQTLNLVLMTFEEDEVTPTMWERYVRRLQTQGIQTGWSQQQMNIEFPPIVIKNNNYLQ